MRKILCLILIVVALTSCQTPMQVLKVTQISTEVTFTPYYDLIDIDGVTVKVKPVEAKVLNKTFEESANRSADYSYNITQSIDVESSSNSTQNSRTQNISKVQLTDRITSLVETKKISPRMGQMLVYNLWENQKYGRLGSENMLYDQNGTTLFNPYYINNQYLTTFELTFTNSTSNVRTIELSEFQVSSTTVSLTPLKIDYFEEFYSKDSPVYGNLIRYHMPDQLRITPGQTVIKYLTVPALRSEDKFAVQYINDEKLSEITFQLESKSNRSEINLKEFLIKSEGLPSIDFYQIYFAVEVKDGVSFPVKNDRIFIDNKTTQVLTICGIATSNPRFGNEIKCNDYQVWNLLNQNILRFNWR
jgi:hypothetical protein